MLISDNLLHFCHYFVCAMSMQMKRCAEERATKNKFNLSFLSHYFVYQCFAFFHNFLSHRIVKLSLLAFG